MLGRLRKAVAMQSMSTDALVDQPVRRTKRASHSQTSIDHVADANVVAMETTADQANVSLVFFMGPQCPTFCLCLYAQGNSEVCNLQDQLGAVEKRVLDAMRQDLHLGDGMQALISSVANAEKVITAPCQNHTCDICVIYLQVIAAVAAAV